MEENNNVNIEIDENIEIDFDVDDVDVEEIDLESISTQEIFVQKQLDIINLAYERFKEARKEIENDSRFSRGYKQEAIKTLQDEFLQFKEKHLNIANEELDKINEYFETLDRLHESEQDKTLKAIETSNLLKMIELGLSFKDDKFIKSIIPKIASNPECKMIFEGLTNGTKKAYLTADLDVEYRKQNAKYIQLNNLKQKVNTMLHSRKMVFTDTSLRKFEMMR